MVKYREYDLAESQAKAFVEFQRVQKSYDGEVLVVKDLSLAIINEQIGLWRNRES